MDNKDKENDGSSTSNSNRNFKLKGPKGWAHKFKKGAKETIKNAMRELFKAIVKKIFLAIFKYVFPVLLIASATTLVAAAIWHVINSESDDKTEAAVSTTISTSTTVSEKAKETYEKTGSLVYVTDEGNKEIANEYLEAIGKTNNKLYGIMSTEDYIGEHKISELSYTSGFDISNAYEFILSTDKLNFNRVTWKKSDRATGEITDLETQVDEETNLKYPKNDEDSTKKLEYFVDMVTPYLQSYVIPSSMLSGIATDADYVHVANFAFQIIDKGYHVIDVLQFTLQTAKRDQTKLHYITKNVSITKYEKEEEYVADYDENGEPIYRTRTLVGYSSSDLATARENAKSDYEVAHSVQSETVEIYKNFDSTVEKQFVYPIIKADTLKEFMRKEYSQVLYSDTDVENYTNSDESYITKTEDYSKVSGLVGRGVERWWWLACGRFDYSYNKCR